MFLIRIMLGIVGVLSAIFFQAWSLPVFLSFALFVSSAPSKEGRAYVKQDAGPYLKGLFFLFLIFYLAIFLAGFYKDQTLRIIDAWDGVSVIQISVLDYENSLLYGFLNRYSLKLVMNLTALAVPILFAINLPKLIGPFPAKNLAAKPGVYLLLSALFLVSAIAPLWALSKETLDSFGTTTLIFFTFFVHPVIILFFVDHG